MTELHKNGCHVLSLGLTLNTDKNSCAVVPTELSRVLQSTPRLRRLTLQLSHGARPETVSSLLRTISSYLAHQLDTISLALGELAPDEATDFFKRMACIKHLELVQCTTSAVLRALADAQVDHPTALCSLSAVACRGAARAAGIPFTFTQELNFDNAALAYLGKGVKNLQHLSIVNNTNISSIGLINLATSARGLTRLNLECCISIEAIGFEALVQASPNLREVRLGHTQVDDQALVALTTPASRADLLQVLSVSRCQGITDFGIMNIVAHCHNLLDFDFGLTSSVTPAVFQEPDWKCTKLRKLCMDGIFHNADDAPIAAAAAAAQPAAAPQGQSSTTAAAAAAPSAQDRVNTWLKNMYRQIERLASLQELGLGPATVDLKLFSTGCAAIESLKRLCVLKVLYQQGKMEDTDLIWLMTKLPSLRTLDLDKKSISGDLLGKLKLINRQLNVNLVDRPRQLHIRIVGNAPVHVLLNGTDSDDTADLSDVVGSDNDDDDDDALQQGDYEITVDPHVSDSDYGPQSQSDDGDDHYDDDNDPHQDDIDEIDHSMDEDVSDEDIHHTSDSYDDDDNDNGREVLNAVDEDDDDVHPYDSDEDDDARHPYSSDEDGRARNPYDPDEDDDPYHIYDSDEMDDVVAEDDQVDSYNSGSDVSQQHDYSSDLDSDCSSGGKSWGALLRSPPCASDEDGGSPLYRGYMSDDEVPYSSNDSARVLSSEDERVYSSDEDLRVITSDDEVVYSSDEAGRGFASEDDIVYSSAEDVAGAYSSEEIGDPMSDSDGGYDYDD
ncbi:hypothetical protein BGX31_011515 [Mortierella sp. GBA43]|nr:hypothetical protein BGX31_011515 [Mortierella sp. GBA43]